jgi:hypothetical protein
MRRMFALFAVFAIATITNAGPLQRLKERRSNTVEAVYVVKVTEQKAPAKEVAKPAVTVIQKRNRSPLTVTVTPAAACPNCK